MSAAPPPPATPYQGQTQLSPADEKLWATLIHVGGIFFAFVPSLVGYLVLKDRGPFIRQHSASALNFQLTMAIASAVGYVLTIIFIGFLVLAAVWVLVIVFSILAAVKANQGLAYTYPLSIKFLS